MENLVFHVRHSVAKRCFEGVMNLFRAEMPSVEDHFVMIYSRPTGSLQRVLRETWRNLRRRGCRRLSAKCYELMDQDTEGLGSSRSSN